MSKKLETGAAGAAECDDMAPVSIDRPLRTLFGPGGMVIKKGMAYSDLWEYAQAASRYINYYDA